jgi:hypothetical protein
MTSWVSAEVYWLEYPDINWFHKAKRHHLLRNKLQPFFKGLQEEKSLEPSRG